MKAEFYINLMSQITQKRTKATCANGREEHCKEQHWNLKYQIQDPIFPCIWDEYYRQWEIKIVELKEQLWQHSQALSNQD